MLPRLNISRRYKCKMERHQIAKLFLSVGWLTMFFFLIFFSFFEEWLKRGKKSGSWFQVRKIPAFKDRYVKYHKAGRYGCPCIGRQEVGWDEWAVSRVSGKRSKSIFYILSQRELIFYFEICEPQKTLKEYQHD